MSCAILMFFAAVNFDDAVVDPWVRATRAGRVDSDEICGSSDRRFERAVDVQWWMC